MTRLGSPRFIAFLAAQFLGAFNDNAFKMTIIMVVLATVQESTAQMRYSSLATALVPIPFLLFSPVAGWLADRYRKDRVLLFTKLPEVASMALAVLAFHTLSLQFLFLVLFLMSTQSAFFSPAKYGILPEVFDNKDLSLANGLLELTTNLAILLGSVAGVFIYGRFHDDLRSAGLTYLGIAIAGALAVAFAPRAPHGRADAAPTWNLLQTLRRDWSEVRRSGILFYTVLGIAYFGFLGSFFITVIPVFAVAKLGMAEQPAGYLLALLSVGVGAGAVFAGRLSRGHVELGLVPLGAVGLSAAAFDLALFGEQGWLRPFGVPERAVADLLLLGICGGLFSVPLNALLQQRSPQGMKGRLIAFSNVLTFAAVLGAALLLWLLTSVLRLSTGAVILSISAFTVAGTLFVLRLLPDFFVRLVFWLFGNTVYRVRVVGAENIPHTGALFVANHVSWVDFLLISAACDRMIRFLMYRPYYEWKGLNWFFRRLHVIPVAAGDPPEKKEESLALARHEIEQGHTVCIFAEGSITRTGQLLKFKRGLEQIAGGTGAPIVPVWLDGVWGSIFSYEGGKFFLKWPRRLLAPVTVAFGAPLPSTSTAFEVRQRMQELSAEVFAQRKPRCRPLHVELVRTAKRHWWKRFISDAEAGITLRYGAALTRSLALRDCLFTSARADGERIGILLPPGAAAALVNIATLMAGKVPVNLDATPPGEYARRMVESAGIGKVVTTRTALERLGARMIAAEHVLGAARLLHVEDVWEGVMNERRLDLAATCVFLPATLAARWLIEGDLRNVDRVAAILFTYPAESPETPLGVELSHHNFISNLDSLRQVFRVDPTDRLLGVVPFSNAFGFTATLWMPALSGIRAVFAAEALAAGKLAAVWKRERISLLAVTPPLLEAILDQVPEELLRSLRFVAVGGGPLSDDLRRRFQEKTDMQVHEGYGMPECSPIVSVNLPDYGSGRNAQIASRPGSTGQPLPGVCVRVVDPTTGATLPPGSPGMLLVKGPNVMRGYVNDSERTGRALREGWFYTGDRAVLDSDGFLTILGPERH